MGHEKKHNILAISHSQVGIPDERIIGMVDGKQTTLFSTPRQHLSILHVSGVTVQQQFKRRCRLRNNLKRHQSLHCRGQRLSQGDPFDEVFAEQFRIAERLQREMDVMNKNIEREVERMGKVGSGKEGDFSWSREWKSESPGQRVYFSESVTVYNGRGGLNQGPSSLNYHPGIGFPGILLLSLLLGAWVSVTAAFNKRYHMTVYAENRRWTILILWPLLILFSPKFRQEFFTVLQKNINRMNHRMRYRNEEEADDHRKDMTN